MSRMSDMQTQITRLLICAAILDARGYPDIADILTDMLNKLIQQTKDTE